VWKHTLEAQILYDEEPERTHHTPLADTSGNIDSFEFGDVESIAVNLIGFFWTFG